MRQSKGLNYMKGGDSMITANQLGWQIKVVGEDYMANTIFSSPTMAMRFLVAVEADDLVYSLELHDLTSFLQLR